ncbi:MAG TPA: OB-fold nucleic acid binding domain-containing protein, partial [Vicinamibacterales bacterium]
MPAADVLQTSLQYLKGVGPRRAADLQHSGLSTVEDLLYRFPIRYEDRGHFQTIASLRPAVAASVSGEILSCGVRPTRRPRFKIFEMLLRDSTGSLRAVWFNQPFLKDVFHPHQRVVLYGKLELSPHGLQMPGPQYEIVEEAGDRRSEAAEEQDDDESAAMIHTGRIVPIYEKTGQLTTKLQRTLVYQALQMLPDDLIDPLPPVVRRREQLIDRRVALEQAHFPPPEADVAQLNSFRSPAHRRLIF